MATENVRIKVWLPVVSVGLTWELWPYLMMAFQSEAAKYSDLSFDVFCRNFWRISGRVSAYTSVQGEENIGSGNALLYFSASLCDISFWAYFDAYMICFKTFRQQSDDSAKHWTYWLRIIKHLKHWCQAIHVLLALEKHFLFQPVVIKTPTLFLTHAKCLRSMNFTILRKKVCEQEVWNAGYWESCCISISVQ